MKYHGIDIPADGIAEFCRRNRIGRPALFGSVLRKDFAPDSDIDVLVEFDPGTRIGLFRFAAIEQELAKLLQRPVDLNTAGFLSREFREDVMGEAEVQYEVA
jgi:predicted nucleotidyltransferase